MAAKSDCYLDTSAFIAFLDRSDTHHPLFAKLFAKPPRMITSSSVINECHGWFLRRFDSRRALEFLSFVDVLDPLEIVSVGQKEIGAATSVLRQYPDQHLTLTDGFGLVLMKERKIRTCWSTDRHLMLGGARLVIHKY